MKKNFFSLEGKHILITGASGGIGRQCAISCSKQGARVSLLGRNKDRLEETLKEMFGEEHLVLPFDLSGCEEYDKLVSAMVNDLGAIDGFVHAAGIESTIPLPLLRPKVYKEHFDVNVIASFELARILSKKKYLNLTGSSPSFVFIASVMGELGQVGKTAYCASKGALVNGVRALALELSGKNIRLNSISPGLIGDSPMGQELLDQVPEGARRDIVASHPLGLGTTQDVANAVIFLLSDSSRWITGTNMIVDGGYSAK